MDRLSWLLLGAGEIAHKRVAPALRDCPLCRLEAVCDQVSTRARDLAAELGIPRWFDDVERALHESCATAVYIATPVESHVPLGLAALRAGKHVLIEKPLGLNARQCAPLLEEAMARRLIAGCAYFRRCSPRYRHLRQMLANETLGRLVSVRMHYASWYQPNGSGGSHWRVEPQRSGGGPLADMGSHMFDILVGLFGKPRILSAAVYHHVHSYAAEDSAAVLAELPLETPLLADFHWCSRVWSHELEVVGSDSSLKWSPFDSGPVIQTVGRDRREIDLPPAQNIHAPLVEDFAKAVLEGRPPVCPASEAVLTNELLDEIYSAAGTQAGEAL